MGMLIADDSGQWFRVNEPIDLNEMTLKQPLVTERRDKLSYPFGDAEMVQIMFANTYIIYGDMVLKKERLRMRSIDMPDTVELHFSLSGSGLLENKINNRQYRFGPNEQNILYMPEFDGSGTYPSHRPYRFFEVHFLTGYFLELARGSCAVMERFADRIAGGQFADLAQEHQPISFAMHQCIQDIMHCQFTGGLKLLFLQAKCLELLTLQAEAFEQAARSNTSTVIHSGHDKDCILHARDYLLQNLHNPPSLSALAGIAGINEFKLKKGFKEMFNNTVFGYLNDTRLLQSKELLHSGMPIKHVAAQLGYSSVQHFSTAFRKKFGVPPGKFVS